MYGFYVARVGERARLETVISKHRNSFTMETKVEIEIKSIC